MLFPKPVHTEKKKRRTIRRVGKSSFKQKKAKADKLFSLLIRKQGRCAIEGLDTVACNGNHQCMHIIGRANFRLRWDPANALEGCAGHHMYYTNHPWEWVELIRERFPDRYEYLNTVRYEKWDKDIDGILQGLEGVE